MAFTKTFTCSFEFEDEETRDILQDIVETLFEAIDEENPNQLAAQLLLLDQLSEIGAIPELEDEEPEDE